jgi:hypothetical protein
MQLKKKSIVCTFVCFNFFLTSASAAERIYALILSFDCKARQDNILLLKVTENARRTLIGVYNCAKGACALRARLLTLGHVRVQGRIYLLE